MNDFLRKAQEIYKQMGIDPDEKVNFSLQATQVGSDDWIDPLIPGVEIYADDPDFKHTDKGLFYEGKRVILYIRDQVIYSQDWTGEFKYHLVWCTTLKTKYKYNSFSRYVVSNNKNGIFKINYIENNKIVKTDDEAKLNVCKHCLKKLNWKDYKRAVEKEKDFIYKNFSLKEFFQKYNDDNSGEINVIPVDTDKTAPLNLYPDNWREISNQQKRLKDYTCEKCGRKFKDSRGLHTHHIDKIKSNIMPSNLQVLCPECHQEMHKHKILDSAKWKNVKSYENKNVHNLTLFDE